MKTIDYTTYTNAQLLDVKRSIDKIKYPDNYRALMLELESREHEFALEKIASEQAKARIISKRVKLVGYFQLITAVVFPIYVGVLLAGKLELRTDIILITLFVVAINSVSAWGILRNIYKQYWVSAVNLSLQLISITLGNVQYSYSGLGGIYLSLQWVKDVNIHFLASFKPGFTARYFSEAVAGFYLSIDVLALLLLIAVLTVIRDNSTSKQL